MMIMDIIIEDMIRKVMIGKALEKMATTKRGMIEKDFLVEVIIMDKQNHMSIIIKMVQYMMMKDMTVGDIIKKGLTEKDLIKKDLIKMDSTEWD